MLWIAPFTAGALNEESSAPAVVAKVACAVQKSPPEKPIPITKAQPQAALNLMFRIITILIFCVGVA